MFFDLVKDIFLIKKIFSIKLPYKQYKVFVKYSLLIFEDTFGCFLNRLSVVTNSRVFQVLAKLRVVKCCDHFPINVTQRLTKDVPKFQLAFSYQRFAQFFYFSHLLSSTGK